MLTRSCLYRRALQDLKMPPLTHDNLEQPASRLLSIPSELRLEIWRLLLLPPNVRSLNGSHYSKQSPLFQFAMPLLCTCRQIYNEAASVLYDENLWIFIKEENLLSNPSGWAFYTSESTGNEFVAHPGGIPLPHYSKLENLVKNPTLSVDISYSNLEARLRSPEQYRYAVPYERFVMDQICTLVGNRVTRSETAMMLWLGDQPPGRSRSEIHNLLLQPFKAIRELTDVIIMGAASEKASQDLTKTMTTPVSSYAELEDILNEYKVEGNILSTRSGTPRLYLSMTREDASI